MSFAATLTTVLVAGVITGSCGCSSTAPVFSFTVYVVVVTLLPFWPGVVIFSESFSLESSFS